MNSRLGESVSDLYRAIIRLGEFKAVYSIECMVVFKLKFLNCLNVSCS